MRSAVTFKSADGDLVSVIMKLFLRETTMGPYADIWIAAGGGLAMAGVVIVVWFVLSGPDRAPPDDVRREPRITPPAGLRPAQQAEPRPAVPPPGVPPPEAPERHRTEWDTFDFRAPIPVLLEYADANGEVTERLVSVACYQSVRDGVPVLAERMRGHCHLRDGSRLFVLKRVLRAMDTRSDTEIADLPAWLLAQKARRRPRDLGL